MGYDAFISYSHGADVDLAPLVRDALQRLAKPWTRRRALSIFLDQASLEVSAELGTALDDRLGDTRWLVLFMSIEAAQSKWVGEEIAQWAETKSKDSIALVLTSGEVVWDDQAKDFDYERSTAVSDGMRGVYSGQESEPLFLDLSWTKTDVPDGEKSLDLTHARFKNDIATIAAPIHGIPKDELVGRDVREFKRAQRLRRAAVTGLALLFVTAVVFADNFRIQRNRSEARRLAQVSLAHAAEETDLAMLLALESLEKTETDEGWEALRTALSQPVLARSPLVSKRRQKLEAGELGAGLNRLLFSPDGSVLASMGADGIVDLWDPATGREIGQLEGHAAPQDIWEAAFSPDGSMLATPGSDLTVRLWAVHTDVPPGSAIGEFVVDLGRPLEGHTEAVWDVAFSPPNGELLATASADSTVRLWNVEARTQLDIETMDTGIEVWEVAFSSDGSSLLWVSSDGCLRRRSVTPQSDVEVLLCRDEWTKGPAAPGVAFSHDGKKLAVATVDWTVQVWDLTSDDPKQRPKELKGHDDFVLDLAFSSDDSRLASASKDRTVRMWDVATGVQVGNSLTGHDAEVLSVAFRKGDTLLASGSADRSVRLWDLAANPQVARPLEHGGWILDVALSLDGTLAAAAGDGTKISVWDVASGELLFERWESHGKGERVNSVAFSPDAKLLASTGNDRTIRLWDVKSGLPARAPLDGHDDWVRSAVFSPDGKLLASASDDRTVRLWDTRSGEPVGLALEGHKRDVTALAFSHDGTKLASASPDTTVRLWEIRTSEPLGDEMAGHNAKILAIGFGPDGGHLFSVGGDGVILRWDLGTRNAEKVLDAKTKWTAAAFSHDSAVMASAAADGSVRAWDLKSGRQAGVPWLGLSKRVEGVAFSRDESLVATGGENGTVRLWPPQSQWKELARKAVGRDLSAAEREKYVDAGLAATVLARLRNPWLFP